jgi:hypothetical protein
MSGANQQENGLGIICLLAFTVEDNTTGNQ